MNQPVEAIVFDFGGVISAGPFYATMANYLEKKEGISSASFINALRSNDMAYFRGTESGKVFWGRVGDQIGYSFSPERIDELIKVGYHFNPDMFGLVESLRPAYRTFILSGNIREVVDQIRPLLAPYFEAQFYTCDAGLSKYEPEFFEFFLQQTGLAPHACVFIDDKPVHIETASRLGFRTIPFQGLPVLKSDLAVVLGHPVAKTKP